MAGATKLMTAGGGGVNLQPATSIASDVTVTLPTVAQKLIGDKTPGTVLQVVQAVSSSDVTSTSTSTWTTIVSASITLSSSSNKVLITAQVGEPDVESGNINSAIFRNGSNNICWISTEIGRGIPNTNESHYPTFAATYLDSPATAGSVTYDISIKCNTSGTVRVGNGSDHRIILMEIAA